MQKLLSPAAFPMVLALSLMLTPIAATHAEDYPSRTIHFIVPVNAGGPNDFVARLLAKRMQTLMGQPVIVENRPGAGGNLGTEYVAKQPPDGYTILESALSHVINQNFTTKLRYDPMKDFVPITAAVSTPFVLVVNPEVPAHNIKEFIALAKAKPGTLNYASAGVGTPHQLATELLKSMTGTKMVHVPYKGANEIIPALLAHQVDFTIIATFGVLPHIKAGKLRAIAMASPTRSTQLPDVPTIAEALPLPGYAMDVWQGVLAPAGTPKAVIAKLNQTITTILKEPDSVTKLRNLGLEPIPTTPERFGEMMKSDAVKWAKVVQDDGIGVH